MCIMNYQHEGNNYSDLGSFVESYIRDNHEYLDIAEDNYKTAEEVDSYIRGINALLEGEVIA